MSVMAARGIRRRNMGLLGGFRAHHVANGAAEYVKDTANGPFKGRTCSRSAMSPRAEAHRCSTTIGGAEDDATLADCEGIIDRQQFGLVESPRLKRSHLLNPCFSAVEGASNPEIAT